MRSRARTRNICQTNQTRLAGQIYLDTSLHHALIARRKCPIPSALGSQATLCLRKSTWRGTSRELRVAHGFCFSFFSL